MRTVIKILIGMALLVAVWFGIWRSQMAEDLTRVKATIAYHDAQFKASSQYVSFRADAVQPSGFPFHARVRVVRPILSVIFGKETYAVSTAELWLTPTDASQGRYRVELPQPIEAVYAKDGTAPENYRVTFAPMPDIAVRAQRDSEACPVFHGGAPCAVPPADFPILSFALGLKSNITMHVELNGESRDVAFQTIPISVPIFAMIPNDSYKTMELFVDVLREAMVFKTPGNEVPKP